MGYAFVIGDCFVCKRTFTFNPMKVPSLKDKEGVRQPICKSCIEMANKLKVEKGVEPFVIPVDAYTVCNEAELE